MSALRRLAGMSTFIGTGEDPQQRVREGEVVHGRASAPEVAELLRVNAIREATDEEAAAARPVQMAPPGVPLHDPAVSFARGRRRR